MNKCYCTWSYCLRVLEVLLGADYVGFHGLLARFPAGWAYLAMFVRVLERLYQTQSFVHGSAIDTRDKITSVASLDGKGLWSLSNVRRYLKYFGRFALILLVDDTKIAFRIHRESRRAILAHWMKMLDLIPTFDRLRTVWHFKHNFPQNRIVRFATNSSTSTFFLIFRESSREIGPWNLYLPTGKSLMVTWRRFCLPSMMKSPRNGIPVSSSSTP